MNDDHSPGTLDDLLQTLDFLQTPAFLVTVDAQGAMRFGGLNRAHSDRTGIRSEDIEGRTPHEALPPRMADTVLANYSRCRDSREIYSYEEVLDLPTGQIWWRTMLTPILEGDRVVAIVGTAVDITEIRSRIQSAEDAQESMRNRAATCETLAHASMVQMRGPLNNIIALGQMLRREFREPMSAKVQLLDLISETAVAALEEIDGFEFNLDKQPPHPAEVLEDVDFGHLCRDLAALIDPHRELSILFPEGMLRAGKDSTQYVLRAVLEAAAKCAGDRIIISLGDDPTSPARFRFLVRFACRRENLPKAKIRDWLDSTVRSRHGIISIDDIPAGNDGLVPVTMSIALPGKFLPETLGGSTRREINRRMLDRASG